MTNAPDLRRKVCLVTGATSGVGLATARALAGMGATTLLVARDAGRGERTRREIAAATGSQDVDVMLADLSSRAQVHRLAEQVHDRTDRLHVLVNNAGLTMRRRRVTEDGLEWVLAVNHLAPFLLTNLLLDLLRAGAPSRVVTVTSSAQSVGRIDFDDLQGERRYRGQRAYNQSKLANVMFTYELARRLEGTGVTATCVHPGVVRTNFGVDGPLPVRLLIPLGRRFMRSPEQGADTVVWLASSPDVEGVSGRYFTRRRAIASSRRSYDQDGARRLWEISRRLTGLVETGP